MDSKRYDEIERQTENMLLADNLRRVDKLNRRGLLRFLDKETTKANTARLRTKARLIVIAISAVDAAVDLARAEDDQ